jgi:phage terminase large subunit-like protein
MHTEVATRREANGQEMLRLNDGSTLRILSTRQSSWRGWSADAVILDEVREHTDRDTWSAAQYTMRARPNTQLWAVSTAGNAESVVLRDLVDRGRISVTDPDDPMGYFEWSCDGIPDLDPGDPVMWRLANPTLGSIIDEATLSEELRADPQGFLCESLCVWVDDLGANQPLVDPEAWNSCLSTDVDASRLRRLWLGVDLDQGMTVGHLVAAGWDGERLVVSALETWTDPVESTVAERVREWRRRLSVKGVAFDPRTAAGVADRLIAAGWHHTEIHRLSGAVWPRATARLVEFVDRGTLVHADDSELQASLLNTIRVTRPDGSWRIRRKDVTQPITATVALLAAVDAGAVPMGAAAVWFLGGPGQDPVHVAISGD